jgi:hypothetical protein
VPKFDPQYQSLFVPETPFVSADLEKKQFLIVLKQKQSKQ